MSGSAPRATLERELEGGPWLPAAVGPWAAYVMVRDSAAWLRTLEAKGQQLAAAGQPAQVSAGRQLLAAVRQIRACARQVHDAASGPGSVEVPQRGRCASSEVHRSSSFGLLPAEVARRLNVTVRQVGNLRRSGKLLATRVGQGFVYDETSVAAEQERRRKQEP